MTRVVSLSRDSFTSSGQVEGLPVPDCTSMSVSVRRVVAALLWFAAVAWVAAGVRGAARLHHAGPVEQAGRMPGGVWRAGCSGPGWEIQFDGFVFPAFDQIVTQVAKLHFRSGGRVHMPLVIRIPFGGGIGAVEHHSESPEAYFAHTGHTG